MTKRKSGSNSQNDAGKSQQGLGRREFLLTGSSVLTAAMSSATFAAAAQAQLKPAPAPASGRRPNIVFMMVDNFGYGDLGCYGGGVLRGVPTPRIDQLAAEGLRRTNFNVEPECTPTRSPLMTGRMPIRSGTSSVEHLGGKDGLTPWEYTLPELLSKAGYTTALYGKWHLGSDQDRFPTAQGFDEWFGIPRSSGETAWTIRKDYDPKVYLAESIMEGRKGEPSRIIKTYDYTTRPFIDREITERSAKYIQDHAKSGKPFFLAGSGAGACRCGHAIHSRIRRRRRHTTDLVKAGIPEHAREKPIGFTLGRRRVGRQAKTATARATDATTRSDVARITLRRRQIRGDEIIFPDRRDRIRDMVRFLRCQNSGRHVVLLPINMGIACLRRHVGRMKLW